MYSTKTASTNLGWVSGHIHHDPIDGWLFPNDGPSIIAQYDLHILSVPQQQQPTPNSPLWTIDQQRQQVPLVLFGPDWTGPADNGNMEQRADVSYITFIHYSDVIIGATTSQITSLTIVYSTVYSDADQRKHQSSASLAFVLGIQRWPVNSPHKWPVTRDVFPFDDVIMK